ncbi:MAG TPA: hypothetical protein EYH09_01655 [Candidatus Nanopusillus sp.]|nr:hypothetical protein [Candidatus Nanopusillus sp.]HIP90297.1 hypothetical protein [Candidatus Nanopusillus sp.]
MLKEVFELLRNYNIPVVDYWVNETPKNIEFPVVVKVDLLHKTEHGVVRLNVNNYKDLVFTFAEFKKKFPGRDIIIQKQLTGDYIELIIGAKRDEVFDYIILFGIGGVYTEILRDFIILVPYFDKQDFLRLIDDLKLKQILFGFRNKPKANLGIVYDVINKFCVIMEENPDIKELEINPFMVNDKEGYVVDARLIK